jgi:hypothetical protein
MHDALRTREMWGGYFFYRILYFGSKSNRPLSPVVVAGQLLGVAVLAGTTLYGIRRGSGKGGIVGLTGGIAAATIGYQVIDKLTGYAVPFLPGAEQLLQATTDIGKVAAEQKQQMALADHLQRMERATALLRKAGNLIEL